MQNDDLSRREFHKLTAAAFGGLLAGAAAGCGGGDEPAGEQATKQPETNPAAPSHETTAATADLTDAEQILLSEPHVCRGLNTCKGKDKEGDNACAGQGTCATVASHLCGGQNECKGQGGCGETPGMNACKGQGGCSVPLQHAWEKARTSFEAAMKKKGQEFGPAPAPMGS